MASVTLNGASVLRADIHEPLAGLWHADLEVDTDEAPTDPLTLDFEDGSVTFTGATYRGGLEQGRWHGRIVGGVGGMATAVEAQYYAGATFGTILTDALTVGGETLDSDSEAAVTGHLRARWQRAQGRVADALWTVLGAFGDTYTWRMTRAGEVLVVADTWPALSFQHQEIDRSPSSGEVVIAPLLAPELRPGVTFGADRVGYVLTTLRPGKLRQHYWTEAA